MMVAHHLENDLPLDNKYSSQTVGTPPRQKALPLYSNTGIWIISIIWSRKHSDEKDCAYSMKYLFIQGFG